MRLFLFSAPCRNCFIDWFTRRQTANTLFTTHIRLRPDHCRCLLLHDDDNTRWQGKLIVGNKFPKKKPENGQKSVHSNESNDLLRLLSKKRRERNCSRFSCLGRCWTTSESWGGGDEVMHVGLGQPPKQQKKRIKFFLFSIFFPHSLTWNGNSLFLSSSTKLIIFIRPEFIYCSINFAKKRRKKRAEKHTRREEGRQHFDGLRRPFFFAFFRANFWCKRHGKNVQGNPSRINFFQVMWEF